MLQTNFDWRKLFANLELFVTIQTALAAYGQPANIPEQILVILRNIKCVAKFTWAEPFKEVLRKIKKQYPDANFVHNEESLKFVVELINEADKLRDRKDAPEPKESARGVSKGKGKPNITFEEKKAAGACVHCVKHSFNGFHLLWKSEAKYAYNPKYKGYRHKQSCLLLGTTHKARLFFAPSKGRYKYQANGSDGRKSSPTEHVAEEASLSDGFTSSDESGSVLGG